MKEIRITEDGHVYLDGHDIGEYVVDAQKLSRERARITLIGKIVDEREPKPKPKKKAVKHDR